MKEPTDEFRPSRRDWSVPVSNLLLAGCLVVVMAAGWIVAAERRASVTLSENRFLTTEWYLLQELKAQTDTKLREKDQEIARLRQRYEALKAGHSSEASLDLIAEALRVAEAERVEILSSGFHTAAETELSVSEQALQTKVRLLEDQLQDRKAELVQALSERDEARRAALRGPLSPMAVPDVPTPNPAVAVLAAANALVQQRLSELSGAPAAGLDELKARSLVRAILQAPEVRGRYPTLAETFDKYLSSYAVRQQSQGLLQAYAELGQTLGTTANR